MPKPLPPQTIAFLAPPPKRGVYSFFEQVAQHPFDGAANGLNLRNAWWLMDAAFLAYSNTDDVANAFRKEAFGFDVVVRPFSGAHGTQGYVASSDKWIVVSFRGTQVDSFWPSVIDWSVDARFVPTADRHGDAVHSGFLEAANGVWAEVSGYVRQLQAEGQKPLWITGHSLGAALATVAANLCSDEPDHLGLRATYTYGSPRVGDRQFGRRIPGEIWRFRNNADLIAHVPLGLVFQHVGALGLVDGAGEFHADPSTLEEAVFDAGTARFSSSEAHGLSVLLTAATPSVVLPGPLADHAPINYAIRLWNCYESSR